MFGILQRMRCLRIAVMAAVLANPAQSQAPSQPSNLPVQVEWSNVARVIAFADVHGAFAELQGLLRDAGIVDGQDRWAAGSAHVVSLGDLLDRGAGSRRVMDLLIRLQDEAMAAGGRLHVLVGNHEAMNLMGDLRYVDKDEFAAYADLESPEQRSEALADWEKKPCTGDCPSFESKFPPGYFGHQAAFLPRGRYGSWLLGLPVAVKINETLFMHAGPSSLVRGMSLPELNLRYRTSLVQSLGNPDSTQALLTQDGPNWYRGPALCSELTEADVLYPLLQQFGARRLVIGHTPTRDSRVVTRFDGRVVKLDTGMNRAVYKGRAAALFIEADGLKVRYAAEAQTATPGAEALYVAPDGLSDAEVLSALRAGTATLGRTLAPGSFEVTLEHAGWRVPAVFVTADAPDARREEAAYRLDRALRLGIVPVTVQRVIQGRAGFLQARPARWFTQKQLQENPVQGSGWCSPAGQFQLIYALDTLAGNSERTASSIVLDADQWNFLATSFAAAFGTDRGLPRYLRSKPPEPGPELRRRLALLDESLLSAALGELIDSAGRRAILKRRDLLLEQPAAAVR